MELETHLKINHLAPYFPYGLKALVSDSRFGIGDPFLDKITGIYEDLVTFNDSPDWYFDSDENDTEIKLALRPISDLTKGDLDYLLKHHSTDWFADTDFENMITECLEHKNLHNFIELLPFGLVRWFIENHYDVFGLIEKKSAIDINKLCVKK